MPLTKELSDHIFLSPSLLQNQSKSYQIPEPNYLDRKFPHSQTQLHLQQMIQDWWKHWSNEYLRILQIRYKWKMAKPDIVVNNIVLIADETMQPAEWPLTHVLKVYTDS